ncbi:MAG: efflux RND transporter permease subunit [Candidatus Lernaella stagnicola]|nr:efflux RND transporter permease subunit [Candidatus Lernaella stagnicola]
MKGIIRLSVDNPVLVNILMATIMIIGLFAFLDMPRELVSEVKFNWVFVITPWPGASSEEVEQLVTIPIEEEIQDIADIEDIISSSGEGHSFIMVKFRTMDDDVFRSRFLDLKAEIDKVQNLPENTRRDMQVKEFDTTEMVPILTLHLGGPLTELELRKLVIDIRRRVLQVRGVAKAELTGTEDRQVWIEVEPELLEAHGLSPDMIAYALAQANQNVPAGKVRAGREEFLLRTVGRFEDAERIKGVVVRSLPGGAALTIDDIAQVTDGFQERTTISRLNGNKAVSINIAKRSEASTIDIVDDVKALVKEIRPSLPAGVELTWSSDTSKQIEEIMSVLRNNGALGLILVIIFLYLAIGARNALLVAIGIPLTFLATFIFMYYTGHSLNANTLFGLILVLGVVVDDAIIIVENSYRHYQMGKSLRQAAIEGTEEVFMPVVSATMTTVAAFLPLMLMPGIMGKFMRIIPIVVCLVLAASMVEAFVFLPSHFAEWTTKRHRIAPTPAWVKRLQRLYIHILAKIMRRRGWVMVFLVVALIGAGSLTAVVGVELSGSEEINMFQVFVELPTGTSLEVTNDTLEQVERAAMQLPKREVLSIQGTAGLMRTESDWVFANNIGEVVIELPSKKEGRRSLDAIIDDLRTRLTDIPGIAKLEFRKPHGGPPTGRPIDVRVMGGDFDVLEEITDKIQAYLIEVPGVVDVKDNWNSAKKEMRVIVDESAASYYGLDLLKIAAFVRTAFEGQIATRYRDGNDEVEVVVRYPRNFEKDMTTISRLRVPGTGPTGQVVWVPFSAVADLKVVDASPTIERIDQERYIAVSAGIDPAHSNELVTINAGLLDYWDRELSRQYPGYKLDSSGQFKEFEESFAALKRLFLVGVFLIFVILGGQFKSFKQPFIILFTIPFAFIGAMFGLLVAGAPFSIVAMYGMVALAGVAVNDAIVLIDFINKARASGLGTWHSLFRAGSLRLRPILLTTITTIGGLLPTAIGLGGRSETWSPLANVIVFGMLGSTLMTLFVIPCIYRILIDDIPRWRQRRKEKRRTRRALRRGEELPASVEA